MTRTPWGDAGDLRRHRLPPGPGMPRTEVERNQRERLMAAMVGAVEARGYTATTVADLTTLAGVSRAAFYRQFANKERCFLTTLSEIVAAALKVISSRYRGDRPWEERGRDALATFLGLLADQPAAARLVMVEAYAAGPEATNLVERAAAEFAALAQQALAQMPGRERMPPRMVRAIIGGLREVLQTRLRRREEGQLVELAPDLLEAMLAYRSPPEPLNGKRRYQRRNGEGMPSLASTHDPADPAERIIAAATMTMATQGYAATPLDAVVGAAGVSRSTLYEHFDGREAVLRAALDMGQERMFAAAAPAFRRARDWPCGLHGAVRAILRFLAAEPHFARLAMVEVYAAGNSALEQRARTIERFARFLEPGFERRPQARPIAAEIAVGSVVALIYEAVGDRREADLPDLAPLSTYIVLSPFLDQDQACAVALGGHAGGPS